MAVDVPRWPVDHRGRLRQFLGNLLNNAFKFIDRGQVRLELWGDGSHAGGVVDGAVIDTGIGIPAVKQRHVVEAVLQADASTTRRCGGTRPGFTNSNKRAAMRRDAALRLMMRSSAAAQDGAARRRELQIDAFLGKPVAQQEPVEAMSNVLGRRGAAPLPVPSAVSSTARARAQRTRRRGQRR